jgi:cobaltochelatase CobS
VCSETNRPVTRVNFGSEVRYPDLIGMYTLNEHGKMTWQDGYLTAAVRYGWVFVADELNAAPPDATMPLHQVTEERQKASLVLRDKSELIDPHPQFRFIGTMNPVGGSYGGTNELNDAFRSRFYTIEIKYLDPDREAALIKQQLDESMSIDETDVDQLCGLAANLRERHSAGDLRTPVTTRELQKIAKLTRTMDDVGEATETILLGHVTESDERLVADTIDRVL